MKMKSFITILLICGFVLAAVFSIFAMNHNLGHNAGAGGCFGALTQKADCPETLNPILFFDFHLNVFRSFSTAVFGQNVLLILWLMIFWFLPGGVALIFYRRLKINSSLVGVSPPSPLIRWLALHENSPTRF
ncbi:MAG: hypothetical protein AAB677_01415 [Patescibacteria group bacterium]